MGIVYEAVQVSLRRRVALKVLPLAATLDPRQLQRFHNEARAAAGLHHSNIVPVHAVGCERGTHYYAMQFIDGHTLAETIRQLRQAGGAPEARTTPYQAADTEAVARQNTLTTEHGKRGQAYFRRVAELGVQAAEALDHAHQMGIVHRDIKPANLMVDGAGRLWVTDFGLAQVQQGEAGLTLSGDLVGTLRYMSPEQALARRVVIDHRTDVYSLGATLYELLALRPVFAGTDRQELLRQIAFEEPTAPRRLERSIPAELETIVLKALEKNLADRYATAQELADDLRNWLEDRPIRARRPSLRQVLVKWARRHKAAVRATGVVLLLAMVAATGAGLWWAQKRSAAQAEVRAALHEAADLQKQEKWPEAQGAVRRAKVVLANVGADPGLVRQALAREKDLEMARQVQEARLLMAAEKDGRFDLAAGDMAFARAFEWYGLDVEGVDPIEAGALIQSCSIRLQLAAALDDWAWVRRRSKARGWRQLLAVSRAADPDDWRNRLRDALEGKGPTSLAELAAEASGVELSPATAVLLAQVTRRTAVAERAVVVLRQTWQRHPADFWVNFELGLSLGLMGPAHLEEAIAFNRVAVALRPQSSGAHNNLGLVLKAKGKVDEAIACFRQAIQLKKDFPQGHTNLGLALAAKGKVDEAIAAFREGIRIKKDDPVAHYSLGIALRARGELNEAIAAFREAIRLNKDFPLAHNNLGIALAEKGKLDEAIVAYREAIRLNKDYPVAHCNLGTALAAKGELDEAIAAYREAIRIKKDFPEVHYGLGNALRARGELNEAIAAFREAIRLNKDYAKAHNNLGITLAAKRKMDEAMAEYRQAIHLNKDYAKAHNNLGIALAAKRKLEEAIVAYRQAIRIKKDYHQAHNNLGIALAAKGKLDEAIAEYREAIRLNKDFPEAHINLGNALQAKGKVNEAIAAYRDAIHPKKDSPVAHYNLGNVLRSKGKVDEAIAEFREAIRLKKDYAEAHCNLGIALANKGQLREAVEALRRGHQLGCRRADWPYPSASWVRETERLARLDDRLPAVLNGKDRPTNAIECVLFAQLCQTYRQHYGTAARFYAEAFVGQVPLGENLQAGHRYNAARAAALAGCGQGKDTAHQGAMQRLHWRRQALTWLWADLRAWRQVLARGPIRARAVVGEKMRHWLADADMSGVRDADALARLPEEERAAWAKLWAGVVDLLAQTKEPTPRDKEKPDIP
jgi:tetratricopeptide (TPR) repeat protein